MADYSITAFADELEKIAVHYHGSRRKLTTLKPGSYVTPHKADAAVFAVPWSTGELVDQGRGGGRPPKKLEFKGKPPKDHPIHIYKVTGELEAADTNTGKRYDWNKKTVGKTKLELVKTIPSWQAKLLKIAGVGSKLRIARSAALREKRTLEQAQKDKTRKTWMKMVQPTIDKGFKRG